MAEVMVYEMVGGGIRYVVPNERLRNVGETDRAFVSRMATRAEQRDPTLRTALRKLAVNQTVIAGLDRSKRYAWRLNLAGTTVVVDDTIPVPTRTIDTRIDALNLSTFTAAQQAQLRAQLKALL